MCLETFKVFIDIANTEGKGLWASFLGLERLRAWNTAAAEVKLDSHVSLIGFVHEENMKFRL